MASIRFWAVGWVAGLGLLGGCSGPQAPLLSDESVYQNNREGFRFDVPNGWIQSLRGEMPSGTVQDEHPLVEYKLLDGPAPAAFQVTCIDLPQGKTVESYMAERMKGPGHWQLEEPVKTVSIHGKEAQQLRYVSKPPTTNRFGQKIKPAATEIDDLREVSAFRFGDRIYFFAALVASSDKKALEEARRAVDSLEWKK
jgi:hypothetical protein